MISQHIFISYSKRDQSIADKIADNLRTRNYPVWNDSRLRGGEQFQERIETAIRSSYEFIAVLSPSAMSSPWVQFEGSLAYSLKKRIIPIMYQYLNHDQKLPPWASSFHLVPFVRLPYDEAFSELLRRLSPPPFQLDQQLSQIRSQLLQADTNQELSRLQFQVQNILTAHPQNIEALELQNQIKRNIDYAQATEISTVLPPPLATTEVQEQAGKTQEERKPRLIPGYIYILIFILVILGVYILQSIPNYSPPEPMPIIGSPNSFIIILSSLLIFLIVIASIAFIIKKRNQRK